MVLALALATQGCSDPDTDRLRETTRPGYDTTTGRLKELTYDANANGRIDTWTEMDGARPLRARIDRDEDGNFDRWEYYDEKGRLTKVGYSRANNGRPDAWAFPDADGGIARIEVSSAADEARIDRWERYAPAERGQQRGALVAVEEDSNGDGRPDKWETYLDGRLTTVEFDENHDGRRDRRLTYESGALLLIESEPDGSGAYSRRAPVTP